MERQKTTISASWMPLRETTTIVPRVTWIRQWNGDGVTPASPGELRTRIFDVGRKARVSAIMELRDAGDAAWDVRTIMT